MESPIDYASIEESLGYPITFEDDQDCYKFSIIEDTFSEQQADELIAYLNTFECFHASKEQAFKPKDPLAGTRVGPISSDDFERRFYLQEGYPLDFKVIGYYWLNNYNRIGLNQEAILKRKIKNTLKWFPTAEREKVLQMILDLFHENIDQNKE